MDSDNFKPNGQEIMKAFAELRAKQPRPRRDPKDWEFANSLDAMEFHIGRYLVQDLKVPPALLPGLLPLIDQRLFEDRLAEEGKRTEADCRTLHLRKAHVPDHGVDFGGVMPLRFELTGNAGRARKGLNDVFCCLANGSE